MPITAIIFDLDGTLIDSIPAHIAVVRKVAAKHGITVTEEEFASFNGMTTKEGFRKVLRDHQLKFGLLTLLWEKRRAKQEILRNIKPFEEAKPALERLSRFAMAIATSSSKNYLEENLQRFDLTPYFSAYKTANDIKHAKPHPEIFLQAAQALGKTPNECVVIEDSVNGIIAAKRAGMTAIAVLTSTKKNYFKEEGMPDLFITSLRMLDQTAIEKAARKAYIRQKAATGKVNANDA